MDREMFGEVVKDELKNIIENLFTSDSDKFWDAFDEAVIGTIENDAYKLRLQPGPNGLDVFLWMQSTDGPERSFRAMIDEMISNLSIYDEEPRAEYNKAVIQDLRRAIESIERM